jgi:hypothetical protein
MEGRGILESRRNLLIGKPLEISLQPGKTIREFIDFPG